MKEFFKEWRDRSWYGRFWFILHKFGKHHWFDAYGWLSKEDQYCLECEKKRGD